MKAYRVTYGDWEVIVAAPTAHKASGHIFMRLLDAEWTPHFRYFRTRRAPEFDGLAAVEEITQLGFRYDGMWSKDKGGCLA